MNENCKTCLFYKTPAPQMVDQDTGVCRKDPPVLLGLEADYTYSKHPRWGWPAVHKNDWCGAWQDEFS